MKKILLLLFFISATLILSGCEREGIVNTDDCRETINIKDGDIQTYYKTFTCSYWKTDKGDMISGFCTNIKTGLFNSKCETAYIYEKEPYKKCPKDEYLSLSGGGDCKCSTGIKLNNKCVSYDEACRLSYGDNVEGIKDWDNDDNAKCNCISGYKWDEEGKKCISIYTE